MYRSSLKELEYVVEGYGPGIVRIFALVSVCCERVFSVQVHVLHEGDFSDSVPEINFIDAFIIPLSVSPLSTISHFPQRFKDVGLEAGAAEVYACADFIVSNVQLPAARFLQVFLAVADACIPSAVFYDIRSRSVVPVFTEYTEIANRYIQSLHPRCQNLRLHGFQC